MILIYTFIKFFSILFIVLSVIFLLVFGDLPRKSKRWVGHPNYEFLKHYPDYYKFLPIIGFRSIVYSNID